MMCVIIKHCCMLQVADLRLELKKRNLPVSGPKPQLIERLRPYTELSAGGSRPRSSPSPSSPPTPSLPLLHVKREPGMDSSMTSPPVLPGQSSSILTGQSVTTSVASALGVNVKILKEEPMVGVASPLPASPASRYSGLLWISPFLFPEHSSWLSDSSLSP